MYLAYLPTENAAREGHQPQPKCKCKRERTTTITGAAEWDFFPFVVKTHFLFVYFPAFPSFSGWEKLYYAVLHSLVFISQLQKQRGGIRFSEENFTMESCMSWQKNFYCGSRFIFKELNLGIVTTISFPF